MPSTSFEDSLDAVGETYGVTDDPTPAADQGLAPSDPNHVGPTPTGPINTGTREVQPGVQVIVTSDVFSWTCTGVAEHGTFLNGDPWVVPSDTIVSVIRINPPPYSATTPEFRKASGSMINPNVYQLSPGPSALGHAQGYDSQMFGPYAVAGDYDNSLNVADDLPVQLVADQSLVSTQSVGTAGARPQIKRAAVLTCLSEAPPAGSFRPPYVKTHDGVKTLYSNSGIDYGALDILDPIGGEPSFEAHADMFARVNLNHFPSWFQRYQHPDGNMSDYGRDICAERGNSILMCLLNVGQAAKEDLLLNLLQVGIDMYAQAKFVEVNLLVNNTAAEARVKKALQLWPSDGGHFNGNKWIILFTGMVLGVQDMIDITADDSAVAFSEDDCTFYLDDPGTTQPEWGDRWAYDQTRHDFRWVALEDEQLPGSPPVTAAANQSNRYRRCCTANTWWGMLLGAAALPNARTNWGHEAIFDYQARYYDTEPTYGTGFTLKWGHAGGLWAYAMWVAYRTTYSLD